MMVTTPLRGQISFVTFRDKAEILKALKPLLERV
jgi:hypothetical protein